MDSHTIVPQHPDVSVATGAEKLSHYVNILKGFELLALAATFLAAVQAQVMSTTININRDEEIASLSAVNSFFLAGFAFSITSALLAFLTARWLQCLTAHERSYFELVFEAEERLQTQRFHPLNRLPDVEEGIPAQPIPISECCEPASTGDKRTLITPRFVHFYFAYTLFIPLTLLIIGFSCLSVGLLVLAWTQHSLVVGIVITVVYLILFPFGIALFLIGQHPATRLAVIYALSKRHGNW